jgi:sulfite reductase (NADPH) flavoprotein alpha-component
MNLPPALSAALVLLLYAALCGWSLWRWRRRRPGAPVTAPGRLLVAYASQTGTAERIARQSAVHLHGTADVVVLPLDHIDEQTLRDSRQALFVVSTYGEGGPPDNGAGFVRRCLSQRDDALATLEYGVLALGNSYYPEFCGFGSQVFQALRQRGARPLFDMIRMDRNDPAALQHWQERLVAQLGASPAADDGPVAQSWVLEQRRHLNPGSPGAPVYQLRLAPRRAQQLDWQAGDIAEVAPRNDPARVAALADALRLDLAQIVQLGSERAAFGDWLARRRLPATPQEEQRLHGLSPSDLLDRLPLLARRKYSIASITEDGALELVVRQHTDADGRPGIGSGWLTRFAREGGEVELAICPNNGFRAPPAGRPMILIGNGTGIAGLRAHLKARAVAGASANWLLFGERRERSDYFFHDEIEGWRTAAHLRRLDLTFSRDGGAHRYVQDALLAAADELREWIEAGAAIYVCGSLEGMAGGVDQVLRRVLGEEIVSRLTGEGRYRRDVY